jgi:amino acid transporter
MAMNCVDARSFAYMNTGGAKAEEAFNWLFNISSVTGLIAWA